MLLVQPFCSKKSPPDYLLASVPTFSSMMVDTNDPGNPSTAQVSNIIILVHSYTHRYLPFLSIGSGLVSCPYSRASRSHAGFILQVVPGYPQVELGNAGSQKIVQDLLSKLGLDQATHTALDGQWNIQWSTKWPVGQEGDFRKCILFQW